MPPKKIYFLWIQGLASAPELVRICQRKWASLNPDHEVVVLDGADVTRLLEGTAIPYRSLPAQALSDIVRAVLLAREGGIWADSSALPVVPLRTWLPAAMQEGGFFAFARPGPDRPISSWFLAAEPGHPLTEALWQEVVRFWSKPRRLLCPPSEIPPDPVATVAPGQGGESDHFAYYWFHYLFRYLIESRPDLAAAWQRCAQRPADPSHQLQYLFARPEAPSLFEVMELASRAPIHKLNWRAPNPLDLLAALGGEQMPVFVS